jgi:EAL domain-containing protein (putative c-di-GMP-specific phosphodiesterase class I)
MPTRVLSGNVKMASESVSFARAELLKGLAEGGIRLAFQPQVDLGTQQIVGFEGVARWHHEKLGILTPGLFLGLAAREGLLSVISRTLIADAAKAVCSWRARGHRVDVGINLSASDMTDPGFGTDVLTVVRACGALPHWIVLEASEEALAYAGEPAFAGLEVLAGMGFKIALDAKGPPIVALDRRARALFCQLKCGGTTMLSVASQLHSVGASGFMRRLDAARAAELPVVAVGAESQAAMDLCAELGFTRLQGKIISMPVSVERCTQLLDIIGVHTPAAQPIIETLPVIETGTIVSQSEPAIPYFVEPEIIVPAPQPLAKSAGFTLFSLDFASNDDGDAGAEAA